MPEEKLLAKVGNLYLQKTTLELESNITGTNKILNLLDVEYENNFSDSYETIPYRFILEDEFDGASIIEMNIGYIEPITDFPLPAVKYYIYENRHSEISYRFVFRPKK